MKIRRVILLLVLTAAIVIPVAVGCAMFSDPKNAFFNTSTNALTAAKNILKQTSGVDVQQLSTDKKNTVYSGDFSLKLNSFIVEGEDMLSGSQPAVSFSAKYSPDDIKYFVAIKVKDMFGISADADIYGSDKAIAVSMPDILSKIIYAELSSEESEGVAQFMEIIEDVSIDYDALIDRYIKVVFDILEKDYFVSESGEVTIGDNTFKCDNISLSMSSGDISKVLKAVIKEAEKDDELKAVFEAYTEVYSFSYEYGEFIEELADAADEIDEDFDFKWTRSIYKGACIQEEIVIVSEDDVSITFLYNYAESKSSASGSFSVTARYDGDKYEVVKVKYSADIDGKTTTYRLTGDIESVSFTLSGTFEVDGKKNATDSKLTVSMYDEVMFILKFSGTSEQDSKSASSDMTYTFEIPEEDVKISVAVVSSFEQGSDGVPDIPSISGGYYDAASDADSEAIAREIEEWLENALGGSSLLGSFGL